MLMKMFFSTHNISLIHFSDRLFLPLTVSFFLSLLLCTGGELGGHALAGSSFNRLTLVALSNFCREKGVLLRVKARPGGGWKSRHDGVWARPGAKIAKKTRLWTLSM